MIELGRVYVTRNGLKAFACLKADVEPPWWRMCDERGFTWLAEANGRALSRVDKHPLDLVETTNIRVRDPEAKRPRPAPEWELAE